MKLEGKCKFSIEDIPEIHDITYKFSCESFGAPEFWTGIILGNAAPPRIKFMRPENTSLVWRQIMSKTQNNVKIFRSMMKDYLMIKPKNASLAEKIKEALLVMFTGNEDNDYIHRIRGKRPTTEDTAQEETKELNASSKSCFKTLNNERFPNVDLKVLVPRTSSLLEHFAEADRKSFHELSEPKGVVKLFIEKYKEIEHSNENTEYGRNIQKKYESIIFKTRKLKNVSQKWLIRHAEAVAMATTLRFG